MSTLTVLYAFLAVLLLSQPQVGHAAEATEDACTLIKPPATAGELSFKSPTVALHSRTYPRLSEIPAGYTGCQVTRATINNRSSRTVVYVLAGRVESVAPEPAPPLCAKGERSTKTGCTSRSQALQASFPAGCIARMVEGKYPQDCIASFQSEHVLLQSLLSE